VPPPSRAMVIGAADMSLLHRDAWCIEPLAFQVMPVRANLAPPSWCLELR